MFVPTAAGYFTIDAKTSKNYFYWFFESRSEPTEDPVVLWLTGKRARTTCYYHCSGSQQYCLVYEACGWLCGNLCVAICLCVANDVMWCMWRYIYYSILCKSDDYMKEWQY